MTPPQKVGIASFCPYNIGPGKCFPSTFYRKLNAGDRKGACAEIRRWVFDGGRDCRLTKGQKNGCYGQVDRRDQESALTCWGCTNERKNQTGDCWWRAGGMRRDLLGGVSERLVRTFRASKQPLNKGYRSRKRQLPLVSRKQRRRTPKPK